MSPKTNRANIKGRSWRRANARDVLDQLVLKNPKASKKKLLAAFRKHMLGKDGKPVLDSVIDYLFTCNWEQMIADRRDQP